MSFEDLLDKTFGDKKPKMVSKAVDRLRPPREVETSIEIVRKPRLSTKPLDRSQLKVDPTIDPQTSEMELDFSYLTNNSSFQRAITEFFKKFAVGFEKIKVRGTKKQIQDSFSQNKRALLLELKEVLKKRNVKVS